jgi:hypothetical protein
MVEDLAILGMLVMTAAILIVAVPFVRFLKRRQSNPPLSMGEYIAKLEDEFGFPNLEG